MLVERKPENEIVDHFRYDMASYPIVLSKDGIMHTTKKSKLKQLLLESVNSVEAPQTGCIADGGALWCCDWKNDETFEMIFRRFSQFLLHLEIDVIVFDGNNMSTKDSTHQKRGGKKSQTVEIREGNSCLLNRSTFFSNYANKENFVKALASHLETNFKIMQCPSDADTSIVKEAMQTVEHSDVTVFSHNTDVLCLLVHHIEKCPTDHNVYLENMTRKKNKQREYIRAKDLIEESVTMILVITSYSPMPLQFATQPQQSQVW